MKSSSELVGLARMFWMMIGPAILMLLLLSVAGKDRGWFSLHDIAFLVVLAGVVFARWYEFQGGNATTSTGDPATSADLRRYVIGASIIGLSLWVVANCYGNYWNS